MRPPCVRLSQIACIDVLIILVEHLANEPGAHAERFRKVALRRGPYLVCSSLHLCFTQSQPPSISLLTSLPSGSA
eukprot:4584945-Prymnesium_polylepis.1